MLLETQIVSRLALLFGTTWLVNSIAITGLLFLVVAGNAKRPQGTPCRAVFSAAGEITETGNK
jgi:hypothetical protein